MSIRWVEFDRLPLIVNSLTVMQPRSNESKQMAEDLDWCVKEIRRLRPIESMVRQAIVANPKEARVILGNIDARLEETPRPGGYNDD